MLSAAGISLEQRTIIGKALSAPLATMAMALVVANLGILPFNSPIYRAVNRYIVPLAVPLLLYDSDLKRVVRDTGSLLPAFGIGAVGTVVGTFAAFVTVPAGWKVACALAARHIGGAINFVAVAETLNIPGTTVSAAIAADNVVVALYFAFLFAISKAETVNGSAGSPSEKTDSASKDIENVKVGDVEGEYNVDDSEASGSAINLSTLSIAIATASVLVTLARLLTKALLPSGTSSLPLSSVLTVIAATVL